jgi:ketosteroid isomerase-like protein
MSRANVEVVRRSVDAWNGRNQKAWLALYHPDVDVDWSRSRGPLKGLYHGRAALQSFWNDYWSVFEVAQLVAHDFIDAGSEVVVPNTAHVRGPQGVEAVARSNFVYTVENDQITRFRMFQERAEALEAAGLRE